MQQHFASKDAKEIKLKTLAHRIDIELTGNEFIALLYESHLVKFHMPIFNRALRNKRYFFGLYHGYNEQGYLIFKIEKLKEEAEEWAVFTSMQEAKKFLFKMTDQYALCQKLNGLYSSNSHCFQYTIKECKGACVALEPAPQYNMRARMLIDKLDFPKEDLLFELKGRSADEKGMVWVQNGIYKGFGYCHIDISDIDFMKSIIEAKEDNRDAKRIVKQYLRGLNRK